MQSGSAESKDISLEDPEGILEQGSQFKHFHGSKACALVSILGLVDLGLDNQAKIFVSLDAEEYRELSPQEEADLEDLLKSGRENAIQDAVAFMENLSEELSQLDQSNIHSLMGSEEQIEQLMEYLEGGIIEVEKMEMRLTVYDELLSTVRETMQKLSFQYSHILRQNTNLKLLCEEVDDLVVSFV